METLVERLVQVTARHPAPALPLHELREMVRGSGVVVTEKVLLQALDRTRSRIRVLDPWRGPWRTLRQIARQKRRRSSSGSAPLTDSLPLQPWVVAHRDYGPRDLDPAALRCMRSTLVHLGWKVDERSPADLARWCGQVRESRRLRERLRRRDADA